MDIIFVVSFGSWQEYIAVHYSSSDSSFAALTAREVAVGWRGTSTGGFENAWESDFPSLTGWSGNIPSVLGFP